MTIDKLVFIYNADSGFFNKLLDSAHKLISPQTYFCDLCALTHTSTGMRKEWAEFLRKLPVALEFFYRDELGKINTPADIAPPVILAGSAGSAGELTVLMTADEIAAGTDLASLEAEISRRLAAGRAVD